MDQVDDKTLPPTLTKFVVGKTSLVSSGFADLKLTIDGVEKRVQIPIKSIGVLQYQEELRANAPVPPAKLISVKPGSEYEKLGIKPGTPIKVYDVTDPTYQELFEKYNQDFIWRTILMAIQMEFVDQEGKPLTTFEAKRDALMNAGLSGHHVDQLYKAIVQLTSDREGLADFLSERKLD